MLLYLDAYSKAQSLLERMSHSSRCEDADNPSRKCNGQHEEGRDGEGQETHKLSSGTVQSHKGVFIMPLDVSITIQIKKRSRSMCEGRRKTGLRSM